MATTLQITQPKALRDGFEIRNNGKIVGRLLCSGYFKPRAEAKAGGKHWQFVRTGLVRQELKVYDRSGTTLLASFKASTFTASGSIELDGKLYTFKKTSFWKQHFAWFDPQGQEVMAYKIGGFVRLVGEVSIADSYAADEHVLVLTLLGLYNLKLDIDLSSDAAAGAVAASVAATSA